MIEGVVGGVLGDIVIDDIFIIFGYCINLIVNLICFFRCFNGMCLKDVKSVCDFNSDCLVGDDEVNCGFNCDFE